MGECRCDTRFFSAIAPTNAVFWPATCGVPQAQSATWLAVPS
ncbi:MAG: hypothetical protein AAFY78_19940 [Cyanobacteria bacterium J06648_16]